jgi:hypothetical protein
VLECQQRLVSSWCFLNGFLQRNFLLQNLLRVGNLHIKAWLHNGMDHIHEIVYVHGFCKWLDVVETVGRIVYTSVMMQRNRVLVLVLFLYFEGFRECTVGGLLVRIPAKT